MPGRRLLVPLAVAAVLGAAACGGGNRPGGEDESVRMNGGVEPDRGTFPPPDTAETGTGGGSTGMQRGTGTMPADTTTPRP